jgi:hypothetical protein
LAPFVDLAKRGLGKEFLIVDEALAKSRRRFVDCFAMAPVD